jgi:hypothetical protein
VVSAIIQRPSGVTVRTAPSRNSTTVPTNPTTASGTAAATNSSAAQGAREKRPVPIISGLTIDVLGHIKVFGA